MSHPSYPLSSTNVLRVSRQAKAQKGADHAKEAGGRNPH